MEPDDLDKVRRVLKEFHGANAIVWAYKAGHSELVLRIERPEQLKRCHLVCTDTFSASWRRSVWGHADLSIEVAETGGRHPRYIVADKQAGFMIECALIDVNLDPKPSNW